MKKQIFVAVLLAVVMLNFNCKKNPTGPSETLSLSVQDVSCTEAWIRITSPGYQTPNTLTLFVNNEPNQSIALGNLDTVLTVESLLPNKSYTFKAQLATNNTKAITNTAQATTLDTTSHNVTWQTFTFGEYNPSVLFNVAIIDENNIWAVGEIYMNDSLGKPDPQVYNAMHWDGSKWVKNKIPYNYQGTNFYHPIRSVFAFGANDIWFCGNGVIHWNDNNFIPIPISTVIWGPYQMNKLWGNSSNDLYVVGDNGNIAHYDGINWQKIESGTNTSLTDIYGTPDGKNIWCCGWDYATGNVVVLEIKKNAAEIIYHNKEHYLPGYLGALNSLWSAGSEFIVGGNFIYRHSIYNKQHVRSEFIPTDNGSALFDPGAFTLAVRGSNKNNVFIGGDNGMVWHYNGKSWYKYPELYNEEFDRRIFGLQVKPNIVAAVGWKNSSAWIIIGKK